MSESLEVVRSFLDEMDIPHLFEDGRLGFQLKGERKLVIAVMVTEVSQGLRFESFFMRKPLEAAERFYAMLLGRNFKARGVSFALDVAGDVYLVGHLSQAAVNREELDRMAASFLIESDGMFDAAMKVGFASYLEADMAWRAKQGLQAPK